MSEQAGRDRVAELLAGVLGSTPPEADGDLIDGGLLDSLSLVELIFALEHEYGVTFALDALDLDAFRSVESIAAFVTAAQVDAA